MSKWSRRSVLRMGLALSAMAAKPALATALMGEQKAPPAPPFDMPGFEEPTFPDRTFSIADFGAEPGGETLNTIAIAKAITACAASGGGRVVVPAGVWLTGPVHLRSNVNLHLHEEAELRFSTNFDDYLPVVYMQRAGVRCYNYSPLIYARDCHNVAVTGKGLLNGQGEVWWPWRPAGQPGMVRLMEMNALQTPIGERVFGRVEDGVRTCFIQTIDCRNVLLQDFKLVSGPSWNIHPVTCENVTVRGVHIDTLGPNNDGIDPDCCRNVLIEHCYLNTGDDSICLKAGRNQDGWAVGRPCENVVVRYCQVRKGNGGIVFGSEMSAGIRNVFVHDCNFVGTDRGIRFKSRSGRGGAVENIYIQDITMRNIRRGRGTGRAIIFNLRYDAFRGFDNPNPTDAPPYFRNIHIKNITCENTEVAMLIHGLDGEDLIHDLHFDNVTISGDRGVEIENARGIHMRNFNVTSKESPVFAVNDARDVTLNGSTAAEGADVFMHVRHAATRNIQLKNVDMSRAARGLVVDDDVAPDAVTVSAHG